MTTTLWVALYGLGLAVMQTVSPGDPSAAAAKDQPQPVGAVPAPHAGFDDDAAYVRATAQRVSELVKRADASDSSAQVARYSLAAVGAILADQLEPLCSVRLLNMPDQNAVTFTRPKETLDRADELLTRARDAIEEIKKDGEDAAAALGSMPQDLRTLSAFSAALRAYLLPDGASKPEERKERRAASQLSPLLEDADPAVAAAASLWQANLRRRVSDASRVLAMLEPALADPADGSMPFALFSRLLRCRVLSDRGSDAAAVSMLMQIEERCEDWLTTEADRADAIRTAQFVQIQVLRHWLERLGDEPDREAEREWCRRRIDRLMADGFAGERNTLYRLSPAVPVIVDAPPSEEKSGGASEGG